MDTTVEAREPLIHKSTCLHLKFLVYQSHPHIHLSTYITCTHYHHFHLLLFLLYIIRNWTQFTIWWYRECRWWTKTLKPHNTQQITLCFINCIHLLTTILWDSILVTPCFISQKSWLSSIWWFIKHSWYFNVICWGVHCINLLMYLSDYKYIIQRIYLSLTELFNKLLHSFILWLANIIL